MNKFGIALAGIGVAVGGAAAASTLEAPLNTLSTPEISAPELATTAPLFTDQTGDDTYITASMSDSVGGGGGGGIAV